MFQIEFYETENGKQPVADFLDSLDDKMAAKNDFLDGNSGGKRPGASSPLF